MRFFSAFTFAILVCSTVFGLTEDELRDQIASATTRGPEIELPAEEIVLTRPLHIQDRYNFRMTGEGPAWTKFKWEGPEDQAAIILDHGYDCELGGFSITGKCEIGIQIKTRRGGSPISHANWLHDIVINRAANGVFIDSREDDRNNEFHRLDRVRVANASEAGFRIVGANVHRVRFTDCITSYCTKGLWGERGNHWVWKHGQSTGNDVDFYLGVIFVAVVIDEHRTEASKAFLGSANHWSQMPITLRNVDWAGRPEYGEDVISVASNGPVVIQNCGFTSLNGNPIRLRFSDHDPGLVEVQGLTITHANPPADDHPQQVLIAPEHFKVSGTVVNRVIRTGGGWLEWLSDVRPEPNPDRGRIAVEAEREDFDGQGDFLEITLPLPATGYEDLRSFTVAGDLLINDATNRTYFADVCGLLMRLDGMGEILSAGSGGGGFGFNTDRSAERLELGTPYRFVVSYDRDEKRGTLALGHLFGSATIASHMPQRRPILKIGGVDSGRTYHFAGSIRTLSAWDRALSDEEVRMEAGQVR